jgi:hypothetical protein
MQKPTMKLEPSTLLTLKHFATINTALGFRKGSVVKTISPGKTIAAKAVLGQEIPRDFAILDLPRFLGVLSLFEEPEITLGDSFCTIKHDRATARYDYAESGSIDKRNPDKELKLPSEDFSFKLNADDLAALKNALSAFGLKLAAIVGDGKRLSLQVMDADLHEVFSLATGDSSKEFRAVISADNLKVLSLDYRVAICEKGMAHLKSLDGSIEYWVAVSAADSYFGAVSPNKESKADHHPAKKRVQPSVKKRRY